MKEIVAPAIELHQQFRRTQEVLRQSRPSSLFNSLSRESKTLPCSSRGKETKDRMKSSRNQRRMAKSQFYEEKGSDNIIFAKKHQPFLRVKVATLGDTPS